MPSHKKRLAFDNLNNDPLDELTAVSSVNPLPVSIISSSTGTSGFATTANVY
jgi:hypothetical protein